ncbi:PP2C family protein-serine/threonine phosphatase [Microbacterium elymi]|uniref:Protein phosphatase 2C domain-containing protein n=1 Tax=Microbacterium elymi TaxID=2909587 RepID=A0ABY5NH33_9MICO|nr:MULTISPECIES: protein phosphatase 2C domain-containing protein [Microbacterium]UUT34470.1 protein phosphatase 2C domain-containing protein [Microbacterium elymi]
MTPVITVQAGAATDTGLRRRLNEDSYVATSPVFLVADGMGGHQAGEVASATVIDEFSRLIGRPSVSVEDLRTTFDRARLGVERLPNAGGAGAGTTLTGVAIADIDGDGYWLAINVGDSRTYRLSQGEFEQISVDHSVVQELIDRGELDQAQATRDSRRNVITRAIGAGSDGDPDYWLIPAEEGDRMLVCSDGLTGELNHERIDAILREEANPQAAATRLVHEAILHGGRDNITALVVDAISVLGDGRSSGRGTQPVFPDDDDDLDADTRPREPRLSEGAR